MPAPSIIWYDTPEAIHRAMWEPVAKDNGMTYEELVAECVIVGVTDAGEEVTLEGGSDIEGMRVQRCWGFVDTNTHIIHAWAAPDADQEVVMHMIGHELGHITGTPLTDELQEELRAEEFGRVARMAYNLFLSQPLRAKSDAETDVLVSFRLTNPPVSNTKHN